MISNPSVLDTRNIELIEAALTYARRGWHVFPLHHVENGSCSCGKSDCSSKGKHPRIRWRDGATTNPELIRSYWKQYPHANIGISTGSISGVVVLDIDPRNGGDSTLQSLCYSFPDLSESLATVAVQTGGDGQHYYYRDSAGIDTSHSLAGIDIQSDGAYVVAPPSIHASGKYYQWIADEYLREFPSYILDESKSDIPAIQDEQIPEGKRNTTLASMVGSWLRSGMSLEAVKFEALRANTERCEPPLEESEVLDILESISARNTSNSSLKTKWQEMVVRHRNISEVGKVILLDLSVYMNPEGYCYPSQETVANDVNKVRGTVNRHIQKAVDIGILRKSSHPTGNGRQWHNSYQALLPQSPRM